MGCLLGRSGLELIQRGVPYVEHPKSEVFPTQPQMENSTHGLAMGCSQFWAH